ncbi:hypothetical protein OSB04_028230 [Centaurea solstitialis]|uniref:Reverse transcriptase Ty1/copia-type domain-containing protein n=1 Tax=Centaurea solstitialis TaxID=347529 RepID=A0AA38SF51_9ASTR|nr:hypothetical protein OSB04_028230 [Centaurea solstitialis]
MLIEARLSIQFWVEAINTACYTQNRSLIVKRFKKTAYELFRGRKPKIDYFHIFCCNCFIKNDIDALGKFDAKADDGFLVGYSTISKAYRVFNKRRRTIEETIHVNKNEAPESLSTFLLSQGFTHGKIDSTLFVKKHKDHVFLAQIYGDDIIFGSTKAKLYKKFESLMKAQYKMSMMGELTYFLGLRVKQSEKGIFISQGKYVREMLQKYELTMCSDMKTPMAPPLKLDKDSNGKPVDVTLYRGLIGSLLYLTASRPIPKRDSQPWSLAPKGLRVRSNCFSDSDFAGCKIDRKSTTSGCQLLGGKLVSWTSKKQNLVSTSTAEAKYVAAGSCCAQVLWMRNRLLDYGFQLSKIPICCDNTSAIAIANNPVLHSNTKHIEIRYHFIKDHVMNGDVELHFVPTEYQLADIFTKPVDEKRFNQLISELGMLNPDA